MRFYMSGPPKLDRLQARENELVTHRLFSLHGSYIKGSMKWLEKLRDAPVKERPETMILDSGAFTAWNAGLVSQYDDVARSYEQFLKAADGLIDEIWLVNLDRIPGERGRTPTDAEITEALAESDRNYERLVAQFGEIVMPVFHQGEDFDRLTEVAEMVGGKSEYICISPRNDVAEAKRYPWAVDVHRHLQLVAPNCRTHGLATTGNKMIVKVPWYSIDSAAWVQRSAYGMVIAFHGNRYRSHYITYDSDKHRNQRDHIDGATFSPRARREVIEIIKSYGFTLSQAAFPPEVEKFLQEEQYDPEKTVDGERLHVILTHYINNTGPFAGMQYAKRDDHRVRAIISLGELDRFGKWASTQQRKAITGQQVMI